MGTKAVYVISCLNIMEISKKVAVAWKLPLHISQYVLVILSLYVNLVTVWTYLFIFHRIA